MTGPRVGTGDRLNPRTGRIIREIVDTQDGKRLGFERRQDIVNAILVVQAEVADLQEKVKIAPPGTWPHWRLPIEQRKLARLQRSLTVWQPGWAE